MSNSTNSIDFDNDEFWSNLQRELPDSVINAMVMAQIKYCFAYAYILDSPYEPNQAGVLDFIEELARSSDDAISDADGRMKNAIRCVMMRHIGNDEAVFSAIKRHIGLVRVPIFNEDGEEMGTEMA